MKRLSVLIVLLMLPVLALAQAETTGRITGNVVDENGEPVANARVEFNSDALLGTRIQNTNENGEFLASLLPAGLYTVTVTAPERQSVTLSVRLNIGQTAPLNDIELAKGEMMTEEVTVYSTATQMETTALGENFNYETNVEELPIQNRDIERVAELAPNVSFGPTPNTLSIAGAPSFDTSVLLDGAEISDPYFGSAPSLFLEDAIEEVQVLTAGVSARYGRFQGGVVNATTKSGGNQFDGTVRAEFSKESWNSKTPFSGEIQSDDLAKTYQGTLGGYMLKDHLWFFAGYRPAPENDQSNTTIGSQEGFTTNIDDERWQLKLTGAINPSHVLAVSHLDRDLERTSYQGLPAGDSLALSARQDPQETWTGTYQGVLTDTMFLDAMVTTKEASISLGGSGATSAEFPDGRSPFLDFYGANFAIYNNHWWDANDPSVRDNQTAALNMTNVLSAGDWGDHTLEYGIQYVDSQTEGLNNQSPTGFNLLNYDALFGPFVFADGAACQGGECDFDIQAGGVGLTYRWQALDVGQLTQNVEMIGGYVQDSWQVRDWRFDIGLRYDSYELSADPFTNLDTDFDDISPRLGVTYNIDENWQAQMTWGRYVSRFNDNVASAVSGVGGAPYVVQVYTGPGGADLSYEDVEAILRDDAQWSVPIVVTDPAQPTRFVADDISAPHADDFNLSLKHALPRNTGSFSLTFTDREYSDLLDDFVGGLGTTSVEDPFGSGASFEFDTLFWDNSNQATREYQALTGSFDYRPGAKWDIGGNWTYSWTEGNYEGEGRNTPSSGSIIGDYPGALNEELAIPYGYLDEDIRHRGNLWGNYRFDFDRAGALTLGSTVLYQSAANWNRTGAVPFVDKDEYLNEAGTAYTVFFGGRGNERFNDWWSWNASARYQIPFNWKDMSAWVKLNVFNVLNNDELISWQVSGSADTSGTLPDWEPSGNCAPGDSPSESCTGWGRIRSQDDYQDPREYLITLGIEF